MHSGYWLQRSEVSPILSKGESAMKRISVFQVLTVLAILVLAVAPVFARTHLKYNDGGDPDSYVGSTADDALATKFTNTDEYGGDILGMRFNLQAGTYAAFKVLIYDQAISGPPGVLKKEIDVDGGTAESFIDYQRVTGAGVAKDEVFFVVLKWLTDSNPMVGMDTNTSGNTMQLDYASGTYSTLTSDAMVEVVAGRLADLSGDNMIDTQDALYALEYFAEARDRIPDDLLVGDTNLDGTLDTQDAIAFLNIFAELNTVDDYFK